MIQLNKIFGRRPTQEQNPHSGLASHSAFAPPDTEGDWDEELADAYLLAQEEGLNEQPETMAREPILPPPVAPTEVPRAVDSAIDVNLIEDRAAMARQQLAAAQYQAAPPSAIVLDLSGPVGAELGQPGRRTGRVKTRLLGFDHAPELTQDPIEAARAHVPTAIQGNCPVGWIVVVRGPGRGAHFALFNGVSQIGRGEDQAIKLDYGDGSISRSNHAAIAYDDETNGFFLGHGGKTNIVRLNDRPVISTEALVSLDKIRIGETTLLFVALCGSGFRWSGDQNEPDDFG